MTSTKTKLVMPTLFIGLFFVLSTTPASAQNNSFQDCLNIENNQERLKCFDQAAKKTNPTIPDVNIERSAPRATTNNPVRTTRDDFGRSSMKENNRPKEAEKLKVTITSWKKNIYGSLIFTTADGQVWRQTDTARLIMRGDNLAATIHRTVTGGYRLSIDGIKRGAQVKRIK